MTFNIFMLCIFLIILPNIICDLNITGYDIFFPNVGQNLNVSEQCIWAINASSALTKLQVIDSGGFIPNGFLQGNVYKLGDYDECLKIEDKSNNQTEIYGKYCLGTFKINLNNITTAISMGRCLPHFCTDEDFSKIYHDGSFTNNLCYSNAEPQQFDNIDKMAIEILGLFAVIFILSTFYDIVLYYLDKKPFHFTFLAFSLLSNGRKIFKTNSNTSQLSCINGIKALSCLWVILGHVHTSVVLSAVMNPFQIFNFIHQAKNMYLLASPMSVDTFLTIAGLLSAYTVLQANNKGIKINVPMMYFTRWLRLTPPYAMVVLLQATLVKYMGNGPLWGKNKEYIVDPCEKYWWSGLLYIENYVNPMEMCGVHTWYLSLDMQLFFLSPLVLIPLVKWPKFGLITIFTFVVLGFLSPFLVTYLLDVPATLSDIERINTYFKDYYYQTHTRFGPYVIGMLFGWVIYKQRNRDYKKYRYNKQIILLLWSIVIVGLLACTYGGSNVLIFKEKGLLSRSFYNGFARNVCSICVCLMITLCVTGFGGPINTFLSLPCFQILSKLSYSTYLVHFVVVQVRYLSLKTQFYFSRTNFLYEIIGDSVISLFLAFFLCAVFESPIIFLYSNLMKPKPKKSV